LPVRNPHHGMKVQHILYHFVRYHHYNMY